MNVKIHLPVWYVHEYLNAFRLIRALLRGEDGAKEIAAIRAEIAKHHPNWNKHLLEHAEAVISELEKST